MPVAEYNNINLRNSVSDEKVIPVTQIRDYFDYQNAANKALNALRYVNGRENKRRI